MIGLGYIRLAIDKLWFVFMFCEIRAHHHRLRNGRHNKHQNSQEFAESGWQPSAAR